ADANGAANILSRGEALAHKNYGTNRSLNSANASPVQIQLGFDLAKVCRAFLTAPSRVFLWNSKKTKGRDAALARPAVSS
ncbi:MAG: hypothetical protein RIM23_01610, partial [Coleofasciculus sp. G3-WIS-01]